MLNLNALPIGLLVFMAMSLFKPFIELVVPARSSLHDATIRICTFVVAVVGYLGVLALDHPLSRMDIKTALASGAAAGAAAIFTYHIDKSNFFTGGLSLPATAKLVGATPMPAPGLSLPDVINAVGIKPADILTALGLKPNALLTGLGISPSTVSTVLTDAAALVGAPAAASAAVPVVTHEPILAEPVPVEKPAPINP